MENRTIETANKLNEVVDFRFGTRFPWETPQPPHVHRMWVGSALSQDVTVLADLP